MHKQSILLTLNYLFRLEKKNPGSLGEEEQNPVSTIINPVFSRPPPAPSPPPVKCLIKLQAANPRLRASLDDEAKAERCLGTGDTLWRPGVPPRPLFFTLVYVAKETILPAARRRRRHRGQKAYVSLACFRKFRRTVPRWAAVVTGTLVKIWFT